MKKQIEIGMLSDLVKRHIVWLMIVTAVSGVIAYCCARFVVEPQYTSTAKMYVIAQIDSEGRTSSTILNTSRQLIDTYRAITLGSDDFLDEIGQEIGDTIGGAITAPQLKRCISISSINETPVMQITVTTNDYNLSYEICKKFYETAPTQWVEVSRAGFISPLSQPNLERTKAYPNELKFALLGMALGFLAYCMVIFIIQLFDNSIKSAEDVKEKLGLPVLGEVPSFEKKSKNKQKYEAAKSV